MTNPKCQRCSSDRVLDIEARCKDICHSTFKGNTSCDYPSTFGNGDNLDLSVCLDCGQVQEQFPLPLQPIEPGYVDLAEEPYEDERQDRSGFEVGPECPEAMTNNPPEDV